MINAKTLGTCPICWRPVKDRGDDDQSYSYTSTGGMFYHERCYKVQGQLNFLSQVNQELRERLKIAEERDTSDQQGEEVMSKTIWKHALSPSGRTAINISRNATILCVQTQFDTPCIWYEHDPSEEPTPREFHYYGTGHDLPDDPGTYIGTFQLSGGRLVFHLYETTE